MLASQQTVTWAKIERIDTPTIALDLFKYRPDKGWRWLQRSAFALLRWIGAHHEPVISTFRRSAEQNDELLKSLLGQEGQWIEHVHYEESAQIYMGPDDYPDLVALAEFREMQAATFMGRIETSTRYGSKWHDIPITVVPWMKGAIIVPR